MSLRRVLFILGAAALSLSAQTIGEGGPGFSVEWLDRSVSPCQDFYQFACGTWMKQHPIPADQSRWSQFNILLDRNQQILKEILEDAAAAKRTAASEQKLGDYYAACMDEPAIDKLGIKPLAPEMARIARLNTKGELAGVMSYLQERGVDVVFNLSASPDLKNSKMHIAEISQSGLGLPDRDYYLADQGSAPEIRKKYQAHVARMLQLTGDSQEAAQKKAADILEFETELARGSLDRVTRRDPNKTYHKMTKAELAQLTPSLRWDDYFRGLAAPSFSDLTVESPDYLKTVETLILKMPVDTWKTYFTWHLLRIAAPTLPAAFVQEDFGFYGKVLTGAKELRPRWKRCVAAADGDLGELLGKSYVEKAFPADAKKRVLTLVENVQNALAADIRSLDWMTEETKKKALEKLQAIHNKIGYPSKWRDYSKLRIVRGDALGNSLRSNRFNLAYNLEQINKPVDPLEWHMTPPTVNAYYSQSENNINFPAGILQPPFYDPHLDDPVNYGGIGAVIGHELTHGFDDQGRKFGPDGNLHEWWTPADAKAFEERAGCIEKEYSQFSPVDGVHVNGKLTLGENVADNGGVRVSHMALEKDLKQNPQQKIGGFTPEQRFFLGYGQIWCMNITDEAARLRAATDLHSPGRFRVNGVVSNMPEFQKAFSCTAGQPMVRANACRVW